MFPFLNFSRVVFIGKIMDFSVFTKERLELMKTFKEYGSFPLQFKIIGTIEKATLSWPGDHIGEIIFLLQ